MTAVIATLALTPVAGAQAPNLPTRIEMAREASGTTNPPRAVHALPGGELRLERAELLAGLSGQKVKLSARLERPAADARLVVTLPEAWTRTAESGLRFAKAPKAGRDAGGRASFRGGKGREVELAFSAGRAGDVASFEIEDVGIVPGTYELRYAWRVGGKLMQAGTAKVTFYAPEREAPEDEAPENPWSKLAIPGIASNASNDNGENSEVFNVVQPGNPDRMAIGSNDSGGSRTVWITSNGGKRWRAIEMPFRTDSFDDEGWEDQDMCCDPAWAADDQGNFWYSLITHERDLDAGIIGPSRIAVNRIGAGTEKFQAMSTGLEARTAGQQDKQMMTVDNSPTSPTYGRVMVVWNEPQPTGGKLNVISHCDTFVKVGTTRVRRAERCDVPENWTKPAPVGDGPVTETAKIYADVAVGRTGKVYVTWLDYSARNAIVGSVCDPGTAPATSPAPDRCSAQTGANWNGGADYPSDNFKVIALLDKTGGRPIPFFCSILAAPGGRVGASPSVEVDRSGLSYNDRVYVAWSDLSPRSGTTRCAIDPDDGSPTPALASHLRWETFVGSLNAGRLPGGPTKPSTQAGRTVVRAATGTDEFLPWLSVDQTTGQAWVNFYSTRHDPSRRQTHHYVRGTTLNLMGKLTQVSKLPSDYSGDASNGMDYGDYQGMDATAGRAFPIWSDNSGGDGEATTYISQPAQPKPGGALTQLGGAAACVSMATGDCTTPGRGLAYPNDIALSHDGKHAYVASKKEYPQYGALSIFTRGASGGLTQLAGAAGCHTQHGDGGCTNGVALEGPASVAVSPEGKHVYSLSHGYPVGVAAFSRNATSGALTPLPGTDGCITRDGTDYAEDGFVYPPLVRCGTARKIDYAQKLVMSPDGKFVYLLQPAAGTSDTAAGIAVFSRNATTGNLTQLAGTAGCMTPDGRDDSTDGGCTRVDALAGNGALDMAFSPDGKSAYVAGYKDVLIFSRSVTTGALTILTTGGCVNEGDGGCVQMRGVQYPQAVIVSPDGKQVYVAGAISNLAVLQRNATTHRLSQPDGQQKCLIRENATDAANDNAFVMPYCDHDFATYYVRDMAFSKDGGTLHAVTDGGSSGQGGLMQLDRHPVTGALSDLPKPFACVDEDGKMPGILGSTDGDCVNAKGLDEPAYGAEHMTALALSPDDKFVYATSRNGESIVNFARQPTTAAPVCSTNRQTVGVSFAKKIKLLCKDELGRPMTLAIVSPPGQGTLGTIDQAGATVTYTPPAGEIGDTSFTYKATNATGASATATVYITIAN